MAKARVAALISGRGSNMAALIYAAKANNCPFEIVLVVSNNPAAEGLNVAQAENILTFAQSHQGMNRVAFDEVVDAELRKANVDYIALAGYMRLLSSEFVAKWQGRILNIHPSLLPDYKGLDTHERALADGAKISGCSVHLVTAELDDGPVLGQIKVAVISGDTPDRLAERVLIAEHQLYPRVLADFVSRDRNPEWLIERVRERASLLPEAEETLSHGMPCFGIRGGKKFGYISHNHHGDGKIALLLKISGADEQAMLIASDPDIYYRPAYFGDTWVAMRLDLGNVDWDHVGDWLRKSWMAVAPKKLQQTFNVADEF